MEHHLSAAELPVLDREEVNMSDLDEDEEVHNQITTSKPYNTTNQGPASITPNLAPLPAKAQPPVYLQQQAEPFIRPRLEQQQAAMPMNLPPPLHTIWNAQPHQQPSQQLPHLVHAPFLGLRGLGLSPLYHHRHAQLSHGGHPSPHDPNKRHTWTTEEDRRLKELVHTVGPKKWGIISTHFNNRNAKQCHQRWHYVLKPCITREPWTEEEDQAIMQYQIQIGNKWSHIAKYLSGRTGYAIRNRYNFLQKRLLEENQRHFRPFLGPPVALHMYAAAAAATAVASGEKERPGRQGRDIAVQQNEGRRRGRDEEMEDEEDGVPMMEEEEEEDDDEEEEEEENVGVAKDNRAHPPTLLEPLPVPAGWSPAMAATSSQLTSSAPSFPFSSTSIAPQQLTMPPCIPTSSPAPDTTNSTSSSVAMSSDPALIVHASVSAQAPSFISTSNPSSSSSSSSSALHGTCKAGPAAAAGFSSSLSSVQSGKGVGGGGADFHEQQYHEQQKNGSHSSFENAVFANLELMATAAGQQQQVPVPTPAPTPRTITGVNINTMTQTREGKGEMRMGKTAEEGQQQGEV
ncbi:myb-like dna-binding domain containing partial [Nannochloropsis oceanica]